MNRDLNRVRRLIKAGRYSEAGFLLKETQHYGVKNVAQELDGLIDIEYMQETPRFITRISLGLAGVIGVIFALCIRLMGTVNPIFWVLAFVIGAGFGLLLPEVSLRRQKTYEMFYNIWLKKR
jgi:hypothetical protein